MRFFEKTNYDFIRWRWHAMVLSVLVIAAGIATMTARGGLPLGVDFSGGTIVIVRFAEPVTEDTLRGALDSVPGEKAVQQYGEAGRREFLIRLPQTTEAEQGTNLEQGARTVVEAMTKANIGKFEVIGTEIVGPAIGADLQRKGIYATLASILGITLYIGFRFRFSFAAGAIAATFHDIFVTLAFISLFGYEISLNVVAALLTITGYSVNDTIVIFDRVRENFRLMRRDSLRDVINTSVNQTLSRTIITAGSTFLAVFALFIWGGEVLRGFAFTMLVGIVSGTYSTIFIASSIAILLSKQGTAARAPVSASSEARAKKATSTASPAQTEIRSKKRKARAS
jgi:preprotein translocase subunit SecF